MNYIIVWSYDNYVPAQIAMGRLQEDGFDCWLKDENTVTMNPIWGNAVGGIKLMVAEDQAQKAYDLLNQLRQDYKKQYACPKCNSHNIEYVSTPRKALNWFTAIGSFFIGDYALSVEKVYHCFNCNHEFPEDQAVTTAQTE
jgi:transcription elongation factor Elf1